MFSYILEDIADFYNGKSVKPGGTGQYKVFGSNGVIGKRDEYLYKEGVIIGRVGAYCGSIEFSSSPFWASDNTIVAINKANDRCRLKFLYYLLKTLNLHQYAGGAAQPLLTQTVLRRISVKIPSIQEQEKITRILSAYDDLTENNTRCIEILEEMAQAIYREWFVHFRYPGHEGVRMVESEMGDIPEGWEVKKLGQVIELAYGKGLTEDTRIPGEYPVYGSAGVVGSHNQALVLGPGIIVGRKGNVGSIFWSDEDFFPIDTVFYVKTELSLFYTYFNLRTQNFINNDAAVPGLSRNQAYSLPIIVPSKSLLNQFDALIDPIFKMTKVLSKKKDNLRKQSDLLLPRLVSGEIDVSSISSPVYEE